ncbi:5-methylcytosine-specific restriction enzyme A [Micromonospora sediminicola]|uniref:5-methylcytosine-specific restriction enzyme A n=1 Tax=Micromonospora sediminicola TaxID=946078 RepID=A0A1A9B595_9ACTN|nr:holin [Micromonospora sediminicola]SBT64236.1 5-methylcytosine-specific restriction enzyme A [Micromonospora sediminicola]
MPRAWKVCSGPGPDGSGCVEAVPSGRCPGCVARAEAARGTAGERGYDHRHRRHFRRRVLRKEPLCVCTDRGHGHGHQCLRPSRHADHWPRDRRDLVAAGDDPNDPARGRGLCGPCHGKHTAAEQPGGWNQR